MPTISVRIIKKSRKQRFCSECHFPIHDETIRLYGMADIGDKPFCLYLHRECIRHEETLCMIRDAELPDAPACGDGQVETQDNKATTDV